MVLRYGNVTHPAQVFDHGEGTELRDLSLINGKKYPNKAVAGTNV